MQPFRLLDQLRIVVFGKNHNQLVAGGLIVAQRGQQFQAIELRHVNVEQQHVRLEGSSQLQTGTPVRCDRHPVTLQLQLELIELGDIRMILDHQDAGLGWHAVPPGGISVAPN